ncbi:hypothetical protein DFJ77DRAFT_361248 [Powellomyces hirtus]|nr:hypothetical protein DFJ77DRAFT_361248 [Powellomyces hirtus]
MYGSSSPRINLVLRSIPGYIRISRSSASIVFFGSLISSSFCLGCLFFEILLTPTIIAVPVCVSVSWGDISKWRHRGQLRIADDYATVYRECAFGRWPRFAPMTHYVLSALSLDLGRLLLINRVTPHFLDMQLDLFINCGRPSTGASTSRTVDRIAALGSVGRGWFAGPTAAWPRCPGQAVRSDRSSAVCGHGLTEPLRPAARLLRCAPISASSSYWPAFIPGFHAVGGGFNIQWQMSFDYRLKGRSRQSRLVFFLLLMGFTVVLACLGFEAVFGGDGNQ